MSLEGIAEVCIVDRITRGFLFRQRPIDSHSNGEVSLLHVFKSLSKLFYSSIIVCLNSLETEFYIDHHDLDFAIYLGTCPISML